MISWLPRHLFRFLLVEGRLPAVNLLRLPLHLFQLDARQPEGVHEVVLRQTAAFFEPTPFERRGLADGARRRAAGVPVTFFRTEGRARHAPAPLRGDSAAVLQALRLT